MDDLRARVHGAMGTITGGKSPWIVGQAQKEGKVQDYIEEFRRLQTLVRGWSDDALMGAFLEGLKP